MKINESKKFIEMSAAEYSQAMTYGTEEYKALLFGSGEKGHTLAGQKGPISARLKRPISAG